MTSIVATKAVDLLCISTSKMYDIVADYPVLANRIKRHILLNNMVSPILKVNNN